MNDSKRIVHTVYIAGPMTGYQELNYPAFLNAEEELRERWGAQKVENPARNPKQTCWEDYMRLSIAQLLCADAIYLLKGWRESKGAQIEFNLAVALGMVIMAEDEADQCVMSSVTDPETGEEVQGCLVHKGGHR